VAYYDASALLDCSYDYYQKTSKVSVFSVWDHNMNCSGAGMRKLGVVLVVFAMTGLPSLSFAESETAAAAPPSKGSGLMLLDSCGELNSHKHDKEPMLYGDTNGHIAITKNN
jgi:hypothetical protein